MRRLYEIISGGRPWQMMLLAVVLAWLMPQGAWADSSGLETTFIDNKTYYVLRSGADWDKFRQLVIDAKGQSEVNAIMDADISTGNTCANDESPYTGTFIGNGHTLNINVWSSSEYRGAFTYVKNATFRDLRVKGSVRGGNYSAGLIGITMGSSTVNIERVWVSADVIMTSSNNTDRIGGFIGHADVANVYMNDCRYDGTLKGTGEWPFGAAFIGWSNSGGLWELHRVYDYCTYDKSVYCRFFSFNNGNNWGSNDRSTLTVTRWSWNSVNYYDKTDQTEVVNLMNGEKSGSWHLVGGEAAPVMETWPAAGDVNFETYDMVPGTEDSEKGMLKIPFSCDQPVKYIDVSYTDENGQKKNLPTITYDKDTYAGFISVPATVQHKSLEIKAKLKVGTVTVARKDTDDAILHKPESPEASVLKFDTHKVLTDAGAVEVKWSVSNPKYNDIFSGDEFMVLRSLTDNDANYQVIGSVTFDENITNYTYKDSTLISSLTEEQINGGSITAYYRIVRATAYQLWGLSYTKNGSEIKNPAMASTNVELSNLHLLKVYTYYTAKWENESERTIRVEWDYGFEDNAVWDSRAQMTMRLMTFNREGDAVDTTTIVLTDDEITARKKVVQLNRSCVYYVIDFGVGMGKTITYYEKPRQITVSRVVNVTISSAADWNKFAEMVKEADGQYDVNAVLMDDITITTMVGGPEAPYRGTFQGNGHTLTFNINSTQANTAPFSVVSDATISDLRTVGTISSTENNQGGLIGTIRFNSTVKVERCRSSVTIKNNGRMIPFVGGFVGWIYSEKDISFSHCIFDGSFDCPNSQEVGGFVGYISEKATVKIKDCLFAPTSINTGSDFGTWVGGTGTGTAAPAMDITNSYYTKQFQSGETSEGSDSPYYILRNANDWENFRQKVDEAKGNYDVNAIMAADFTVNTMVGESESYRGTFRGNGHTLTVNIDNGSNLRTAPFGHVKKSNFSDLHIVGSVKGGSNSAGLIGYISGGNDVNINAVWVSADITTTESRLGGFVGSSAVVDIHGQNKITITNCRFDGSLNAPEGEEVYGGVFLGWVWGAPEVLAQHEMSELYEDGTYNNIESVGFNQKQWDGDWETFGGNACVSSHNWKEIAESCRNITDQNKVVELMPSGKWHVVDGKAVPVMTVFDLPESGNVDLSIEELLSKLGNGWTKDANGKPVPITNSVEPIGDRYEVTAGQFYYESLGHIITNSLKTETQQSSVVLTWEKSDDTVDYYRVERRNVTTHEEWKVIAPQVTGKEYVDKTVSPVFDYEYRVSSVNDCEGLHVTTTDVVAGNCVKTGKVEGYVRFADGSGISGIRVSVSQSGEKADPTKGGSCVTDESGFYSVEGLEYWGNQQGAYAIMVSGISSDDLSEDCNRGLSVTFDHKSNYEKDYNFTVIKGVKFTGQVMYFGTSIPVKGARFTVDGREVHTAAGPVESDFNGAFAFRMLPGQHKVQAVMKGHKFAGGGYYTENNNIEVNFQNDVANTYFYDSTQVKLIGRVAGGHVQGALPLGNSLSTNNLGDSLKIVLTLEGDNSSWLVFDNTNRSLTTRDVVYNHKKHDQIDKNNYSTRVHTERHRMVVYPDKLTGEYEVMLPPVKWKIQQITAEGYATLFQDGETSDVIDLTDSLTLYSDTIKGSWKSRGGVEFAEAVEEYNAKYSRIYHSPVLLEYKQQGFDNFSYFGEKTYTLQPVKGVKKQIPIAYSVRKDNWPAGKRDSLETRYTFGYPVFSTDRGYGLTLSAIERYYYNNNTKSDTIDVVKLNGGFVSIRNGLMSGTQLDTLTLDENGEGNYTLRANRTPYMLTGTGALCTVTFTMERDGTTFEGVPLKAYVFSQQTATGAQDIISINRPVLVDILRDPPGGGSSAKLSKGSSLKLAYQVDMAWSAGLSIGVAAGGGMDGFSGVVAAPMGGGATFGMNYSSSTAFSTSFDIVFSGTGQRAFSYTMTANEDISTDAGSTMVGADADLYIGMETNMFARPAVAIQALTDSVFHSYEGALKAGRMVEIASGRDENNNIFHLVRSEVISYGQTINSTFVHSQQYLVKQLIPKLAKECEGLMFTGTMADAQALADSKKERVYLSLITDTESERFGVVNTDKNGNYVYHTTNSRYQADDASLMNYIIVLPSGDDGSKQEDLVQDISDAMCSWVNMIARNEKEKLDATDKVKNFEVDGGGSISYGEEFSTDYSNASTYNWIGTDASHSFFDEPKTTAAQDAAATFTSMAAILGPTVAKLLGSVLKTTAGKSSAYTTPAGQGSVPDPFQKFEIKFVGMKWSFSLTPVIAYKTTPKLTEDEKYSRKESFTIKMHAKSHLSFDLYRVAMIDSKKDTEVDSRTDVFVEENFLNSKDYVKYFIDKGVGSRDISKAFQQPRSFVYRTVGGATVRPWEPERKTMFERPGTILDVRTKKIENPIIKMDRQSISGVPHSEPARFKLYMTNESEQPEAVSGGLQYYTLYLDSKSNPKGAKMAVDGIPLSGDGTTVKLLPGEVTEKTLEVWAGEDFDYDDLQIGVISQGDVQCCDEVKFSVHYRPTAGNIEIASPGDKWIMNCDAPTDARQGWYMPVIISGFDKNQKNFDHIEFQYKESTRGDDYWTNLCGYYADSTLYRAATGTKEMIPDNGDIITKFYGEGTVMEKAYDLRARIFRRNGNSFITSDSKVLSGIKDTRRPQLFGQPEPKDGIIGNGDNIVFHFTEAIEHNYLHKVTNFEVVGETNETALSEEPSLLFSGKGYAETDARRNFADKNMTIDLMVRPDNTGEDMPLFSHGTDGSTLQLWLTKDWTLRAVIDTVEFESQVAVRQGALQQVALILDNEKKQALLWNDSIVGTLHDVTYSGYGTLIFGATNEVNTDDRRHYSGRMLEARLWNRTMTDALLNSYGKRQLTGYELGLAAYYPMNDGESQYAVDMAHGANARLNGAAWALPQGMSLSLDFNEQKPVKGMQLNYKKMQRGAEQDYTLMFWFKTNEKGQGALLSNGRGAVTDDDARNKFFVGFENNQLIYRTNGRTLPLGKGLADDSWHHFAITVNRSHQVANLYVDRVLTQSISTDTLGGMMGSDFYVGNMVWHNAGADVQTLHQENALTGHIDELCLFSQALPPTLLKRYSTKSPNGLEKGLLVYMGFTRQERQQNNNLELRPYALNQLIKLDMDGNPTEEHDSVFVEPVAYVMQHIDLAYGAPVQSNQDLRNLNFSFVGRDNQLLVNIDELNSRINKHNLYVTVTDIPDLNGNYMASPVTMEFFMDRNPLRWECRNLQQVLDADVTESDETFSVKIQNNSGASHTYTIDNLPRWMTVDRQMDIIDAKSELTLQFTVSKDLNVGTYDEIIYLTDEDGLAEPLALTIRKEGSKPDWKVSDDMKHFSMNLVGQVRINDAIVTDPDDVVAAFDAMGRCMGVANIKYNATTAKSQLFMTLFNNEANLGDIDLTFKLWHEETGQILLLETDRKVKFNHSTIVGSVNDPVMMTAGSQYYQELSLNPGWNWISLNVDNNIYRNVVSMLNQYQWEDGDIVTDDTEDFTLVYKSSLNTWVANNKPKEGYSITPQRSYRVYVKNNITVDIKGYPLKDESQRKITVNKGWNNIGYTPMVNLPVTTALADYAASDGDVVKSREEFAVYTEESVGGGYWSGSLQYMKPGEGYMLYRKSEEEMKFLYPYYEPGSTFFERTVTSAAAKRANFADNMTMVATAEGIELQEDDRLLAFSNGELRGECTALSCSDTENAQPLFFLTIAGEAKAGLSFAIERDGELIGTTAEVMGYENNALSGTPAEPTVIRFTKGNFSDGNWYTLQGYKLSGKPQKSGIYIYNGKKQVVK